MSYLSTVVSDSPTRVLNLLAILLSALSTSSFFAACTCSSARTSPVRQSFARSPSTYWLPRLAIEPSSTTALAVRSQISRATLGVSRASEGWPISRRACWICWSEMMLRKGDCSSCTDSPCRSVPSKTVSPVVFVKSARTIVSLLVSFGVR